MSGWNTAGVVFLVHSSDLVILNGPHPLLLGKFGALFVTSRKKDKAIMNI